MFVIGAAGIGATLAIEPEIQSNHVFVDAYDKPAVAATPTQRLTGSVSGLIGTLVVVAGEQELVLTLNGPFHFPLEQPLGARYHVTIRQEPALSHGA
jgi:hypothetical protein